MLDFPQDRVSDEFGINHIVAPYCTLYSKKAAQVPGGQSTVSLWDTQ